MAKKHVHEEHANHEAWAIPYGDLVTLLLAFFVVMYAISSVNEGKYRAVSDSLNAAFGGPPRSVQPIQLGKTQRLGSSFDRPSLMTAAQKTGPTPASMLVEMKRQQALDIPRFAGGMRDAPGSNGGAEGDGRAALASIGRDIQAALSDLVEKQLVTVRRGADYLEIEIRSDILFASGVATPSSAAQETARKVAGVLAASPNSVRVEGYTDDRPIATAQFASNWELSAARAAAIVHVMAASGVAPSRMAVVGYGEHQPVADNATAEGRNANRRVLLVILAAPDAVDAVPAATLAATPGDAAAPAAPAAADAASSVVAAEAQPLPVALPGGAD